MNRKTYAVDWDGTMVEYHGFVGACIYGAPIPTMVNRVRQWIAEGHEVIIFTSRASSEHNPKRVMEECMAIDVALQDMGLPRLQVTANKFMRISVFWDDRAIGVERNTGIVNENLGTIQRSG